VPGLVPGIRVFVARSARFRDVGGRNESGHGVVSRINSGANPLQLGTASALVRDQEVERLRLRRDADDRPGIGGARIGLALPQLAVEADAAELAGNRQALGAAR